MSIALIDTGCANLASVRFALERGGHAYEIVRDPDEARACDRLILPGVGAAAPAMERLTARGWAASLREDARPLLGICLGMQLLFAHSAEGDVPCLGLIEGRVEKLPPAEGLVWPHMGWNSLDFEPGDEALLDGIEPGDFVYFVHGFYVPFGPAARATTGYGATISALVRSGSVTGCQFHPERSGKTGARILANFSGASS